MRLREKRSGRYRVDLENFDTLFPQEYLLRFGYPAWGRLVYQLLLRDFRVDVVEAVSTKSKYLYVSGQHDYRAKVRISDHRPGLRRDWDYYVGDGDDGLISWRSVLQKLLRMERAHIEKNQEKSCH